MSFRSPAEGEESPEILHPPLQIGGWRIQDDTFCKKMKLEKKIFLDKSDDLDAAVDAIINASGVRVILNIPKGSVLGESVHNFQILRREGDTAGKELSIESIDEHVLELASIAKIPALNPIFKTKERAVTDIIPRTVLPPSAKRKITAKKTEEDEENEEEEEDRETPKRAVAAKKRVSLWRRKKNAPIKEKAEEEEDESEEIEVPEEIEEEKPGRKKRGARRIVGSFVALVLLVTVGYAVIAYILPRVTIQMTLKKAQANFNLAVTAAADTATTTVVSDTVSIPGQILTADKNVVMSFTATGTSEQTGGYAGGMLTVWNAYSTSPQVLVATTRFQSPDGKIFRLIDKTVIPGAKMAGGKLQPSSVDVKVRADQAGDSYDLPRTNDLWMIPGFKGTARYQKFYATMKTAMSGGFTGTRVMPSNDDIAAAKQKAEQALQDALQAQMTISGSNNYKLLSGASDFEVTNETISSSTASDGTFSVFAQGTLKEVVFDEDMLKSAIMESAGISTAGDMKIDTLALNYGTSTLDIANGRVSFAASGSILAVPNIDYNGLKQQIAGDNEADLKTALFSLPGLQKANISFWPFWVTTVPQDTGKISFVVQ